MRPSREDQSRRKRGRGPTPNMTEAATEGAGFGVGDPSPERPGSIRSHSFRLRNRRARSRTMTAGGLRVTRCALPAFIRSPGSVQVRVSKSISDQRAPRVSPLRRVSHNLSEGEPQTRRL